MSAQSVAPVAHLTVLDTLARRVNSSRTVTVATLRRREQEAFALCASLDTALGLLATADNPAWFAVMAVRTRAHAIHTQAYRRLDEAWQAEQAARHEAELLGAALHAERLDFLFADDLVA
jgi:hypothetical protein